MLGQRVCYTHGGATAIGRANGERRLSEARTLAAIGKLNLDNLPERHPHDVLIEELTRSSAVVAWLDRIVTADDQVQLVDATAWVDMWERQRRHLLAVAKACADAQIDERRVRIAEQTGEHLAAVLERFAAAVLDAVSRALADHADAVGILRGMWAGLVSDLGSRELLAAIEPASPTVMTDRPNGRA